MISLFLYIRQDNIDERNTKLKIIIFLAYIQMITILKHALFWNTISITILQKSNNEIHRTLYYTTM